MPEQIVERLQSPTTRDYDSLTSLVVTIVSGSVDVVADSHTTRATLEVRDITGPPLTTTWSAGTLKVEQVKDAEGQIWGAIKTFLTAPTDPSVRPSARITLRVPDEASVSVRTVSADVLAGGSHGPVTIYTVSGTATLDRPTGRIDVSTVSGAVECASPAGDLKAKTVSGDITVQDAVLRSVKLNSVSGRTILDLRHGPSLVTANAVSGELSVRMPADSGYDATVSSTSGHVVVDGEPLIAEGKRGGHRHVGDRSIAIKARTVSGDLVVLRRTGGPTRPAGGPVIGDPVDRDVQDEVRGRRDTGDDTGTVL